MTELFLIFKYDDNRKIKSTFGVKRQVPKQMHKTDLKFIHKLDPLYVLAINRHPDGHLSAREYTIQIH